METKKDCFAYSIKKDNCTALDDLYCQNENCSFYMTKEQYQDKMKNIKK